MSYFAHTEENKLANQLYDFCFESQREHRLTDQQIVQALARTIGVWAQYMEPPTTGEGV